MKLIEKIKNALFEEEEDVKEPVKEVKQVPIAKKIDIEKTRDEIEKKEEIHTRREEKTKTPIIFDDADFLMDVKEPPKKEVKEVKKEERILYGGYDNKEYGKTREKFKPSPILSPVYGVIKGVKQEDISFNDNKSKLTYEKLFEEEKKTIDFDKIREKVYGVKEDKEEEKEELFYDIQNEDRVAIDKITLGDAEEYFNDLGLEYNVDYEDKEKQKTTRSSKNKVLRETVDEEIKEEEKIKEELKQKEEEIKVDEEKNLYDLIDMMYDNKE